MLVTLIAAMSLLFSPTAEFGEISQLNTIKNRDEIFVECEVKEITPIYRSWFNPKFKRDPDGSAKTIVRKGYAYIELPNTVTDPTETYPGTKQHIEYHGLVQLIEIIWVDQYYDGETSSTSFVSAIDFTFAKRLEIE